MVLDELEKVLLDELEKVLLNSTVLHSVVK
jgi:hypothetical protein